MGVWDAYTGVLLVSGTRVSGICYLLMLLYIIVGSFGAAFTSFYRLVGPFRSEAAPRVIKGEIWETITRCAYLDSLAIRCLFHSCMQTRPRR